MSTGVSRVWPPCSAKTPSRLILLDFQVEIHAPRMKILLVMTVVQLLAMVAFCLVQSEGIVVRQNPGQQVWRFSQLHDRNPQTALRGIWSEACRGNVSAESRRVPGVEIVNWETARFEGGFILEIQHRAAR